MVPLEEKRLKPKFVSSRDSSRTAETARRQRLVSCMALKETPDETGASYENRPKLDNSISGSRGSAKSLSQRTDSCSRVGCASEGHCLHSACWDNRSHPSDDPLTRLRL